MAIEKHILECKDFDEVLRRGLFGGLSEELQIEIYNHFMKIEEERDRPIPYVDIKRGAFDYFPIIIDGANTTIGELLYEDYGIRACKEKRGKIRGLAAWLDEGNYKYLGAIYVLPEFRGRGIMGGLIADGNDGRPILTKVHRNNILALNSFKRYGFEEDRMKEDFFELSFGNNIYK